MSCKIRWTWERLSMSVVMGSRVDKHFLSIHVGRGSSRHEELGEAPMTLPTSSSDTDLNSSMGVPVKGARVVWRWSGNSTGFSARPTWTVLMLSVRKELNWSEVYVFLWPQTSKIACFFRFMTAPKAQNQTSGSVATRAMAIHEFFAPFEENRLRSKNVYAFLWPKTWKIWCLLFLTPPWTTKKMWHQIIGPVITFLVD